MRHRTQLDYERATLLAQVAGSVFVSLEKYVRYHEEHHDHLYEHQAISLAVDIAEQILEEADKRVAGNNE